MIYFLILFAILVVFAIGILVGAYCFVCDYGNVKYPKRFPKDADIDRLPRCTCNDVDQCETWCRAKALFKKHPPFNDC